MNKLYLFSSLLTLVGGMEFEVALHKVNGGKIYVADCKQLELTWLLIVVQAAKYTEFCCYYPCLSFMLDKRIILSVICMFPND